MQLIFEDSFDFFYFLDFFVFLDFFITTNFLNLPFLILIECFFEAR